MRKIYFIGLLFLCSCSKTNIDTIYTVIDNYAYGLDENNIIVKVNIDYEINKIEDIFYLYTNYQNQLPLNVFSPAHVNVDLIDVYIKDKDVYYVVDNFIFLSDIGLFKTILSETNKLYGYGEAHFIFNGTEV